MSVISEPVLFELILQGTVPMLLPFLRKFARDRGLGLSPGFLEPTDVYARLRLIHWIEERYSDLGQISLQTIPDDRVQVYFSSEPVLGPKDVDLDNREFSQFCQEFFAELIRVGFIMPPPDERSP